MSLSTSFQAARLAAAQPLQGAQLPVLPVCVTPELIAGLEAAVATLRGMVEPANVNELACVLLNARILARRASLS